MVLKTFFFPGLVACTINQYRCASGQCVSEALRCDGYADCSDRTDEVDCTRPPRCPPQLRCPHSHLCLQKEWLCDGEDDCKDGSDEKVKKLQSEWSKSVLNSWGSLFLLHEHLSYFDSYWSFAGQTKRVLWVSSENVCEIWSCVSRTACHHQQSAGNTSGSVETAVSAFLCPGGVTGRRTVTVEWTRTNVSMLIPKYWHLIWVHHWFKHFSGSIQACLNRISYIILSKMINCSQL